MIVFETLKYWIMGSIQTTGAQFLVMLLNFDAFRFKDWELNFWQKVETGVKVSGNMRIINSKQVGGWLVMRLVEIII